MGFFAGDWTGPAFELFGTAHVIGLLVIALFITAVLVIGRRGDEKTRTVIRYGLVGMLLLAEVSWHIWNAAVGRWTISTMMPLHLCSVLIWLCAYMLITKNRVISEFAYLLGVAGALQALLTPDAGAFGFPHYRFFQTLTSHCALISSALYMVFVEGYHPTWDSVKRVVIGSNIYGVCVFGINYVLQSNYLFIRHKPLTASLIDLMPPWPWYIAFLEILALLFIGLSYLPFGIRELSQRKAVEVKA